MTRPRPTAPGETLTDLTVGLLSAQRIEDTAYCYLPTATARLLQGLAETLTADPAVTRALVAGREAGRTILVVRSRRRVTPAELLATRLGERLALEVLSAGPDEAVARIAEADGGPRWTGRAAEELLRVWRKACKVQHVAADSVIATDVLASLSSRSTRRVRPVIGWREWAGLPDFAVPEIKVKVDSGARSSSLHAFGVRTVERDGRWQVRFAIHPRQRTRVGEVVVQWPVDSFRRVRSSSGHTSVRPVIVTTLRLGGVEFPIELTLANRDQMGFRMLLGREAFRGRFLLDAGRSYVGGRPPTPTDGPEADPTGPPAESD